MKKLFALLFLSFFPMLAMADGISLAPPITDSSVVYLSNLFGVVDGVLSGTGSQIMGAMFGVFNSAVLALGGIVIMYTVLIGTMNTAHEGQALGEKWSSIWIPLRSTAGLALLMPKASGYCLMQIFVMWVILQGVGAADLVWNAALGYLNRGGVIVQQQTSPIKGLIGASSEMATGGVRILAAQVCMLGLQEYLTNQRQANLDSQSSNAGPCYNAAQAKPVDSTSTIAQFCNNAVPDFLNSVNAVTTQNDSPNQSVYNIPMPNLDLAPYSSLNGICGNLTWNKYVVSAKAQKLVGTDDTDTVALSRAIAIQQMYSDLATVAQRIIGNAPDFASSTTCPGFVAVSSSGQVSGTTTCYSKVATSQYGVGYLLNNNVPCVKPDNNCQKWGSVPTISSAPLFLGTEFQSALADYNGIMMPTLNLAAQTGNMSNAQKNREFIAKAEAQGWIMAGSYYYNLILLNDAYGATTNYGGGNTGSNRGTQIDSGTGLSTTTYLPHPFASCLNQNGSCMTTGDAPGNTCALCQMMATSIDYTKSPIYYSGVSTSSQNYLKTIAGLVDGSNFITPVIKEPTFKSAEQAATTGFGTSTVYGLVNNESMISIPGQPGTSAPSFAVNVNIVLAPGPFYLTTKSFPCNGLKFFNTACIGKTIGIVIYNNIIVVLVNFLLDTVVQAMNSAVLMFLVLPLNVIAVVFQYGMQSIQQTGLNPILQLAMMGTTYINTSMEMWLYIINFSILTALIPVLGVVIFALIALAMPLLIGWLGVMTSIGFTTAYFIPFVPYINFLFGSLAWFTSVIEAMVAAPLIALGVSNPEGHDAFGKGESSIMILLNVFLRPALMIIGFIAAISLSYISVWLINEGFSNALQFMNGAADPGNTFSMDSTYSSGDAKATGSSNSAETTKANWVTGQSGYVNWAGVYAFFFASLMYTSLYLAVVQNAFNLIYMLPDKVLRWIGGGDDAGQQAMRGAEQIQGKIEQGAKATEAAGGSMQKQMTGMAQEGMSTAKSALSSGGGSMAASGGGAGDATPKLPGK